MGIKLQNEMPVCVVTSKGRFGPPKVTTTPPLEIGFIGEEDDGSQSILLIYENDVPVLAQIILDSLFLSRAEMYELFEAAAALTVIKAPESHVMASWENDEWQLWLSDEEETIHED